MVQKFSTQRLCITRQHKTVLTNIDLSMRAGEVVAILGANGAGKSTLLSSMAGELTPDSPETAITLNGRPLETLCRMEQARHRAVLPQKSGLAFDLDVNQVVGMGAYPYPELDDETIRQLTQTAMDHAHVHELSERRYLELSGGEQQRVHYARTILQILCGVHRNPDTRYILLDEPTSSLDPLHQHSLLDSVRTLVRAHNVGALVILHDVNLAALFCDRIALLCEGAILACDTPEKVLTPDHLHRVYGVHAMVMAHPRHDGKPLVVFG